jgi:hypothetical protein
MFIGDRWVINPLTRKMQVLGPLASTQARKLPLPESFRFVTSITAPPRPPTDSAPAPWASGNAGQPALGQFAEVLGVDGVGFDEDVVELTATFAVADMAKSASLVAVIVSVPDFDGAVYAPDEVILPRAAVQETALLLVLP